MNELASGQTRSMSEAGKELTESLARNTNSLRQEFAALRQQTLGNIEQVRIQVDQKLTDITNEVTTKLDKSMKDQSSNLDQTVSRLERQFGAIQTSLVQRLDSATERQSRSEAQARKELNGALSENRSVLQQELTSLTDRTSQSIERIRVEVGQKLETINEKVAQKLDQNIKEGFKQFEKVQQHLRAAEEQLKNVSMIGNSINDLNSLLKLPHLRGRFGEASLKRLLADFLPAHMYELQASAGTDGRGRADAIIKFPGRCLPIDAKFPREQVLPLFESNDPSRLAYARQQLARVMKEQAKQIASYIDTDNGTTDMALMYLPSETLYIEVMQNGDLSESLTKQKIFPVSPNTLIVTLRSIHMVLDMYEYAMRFERVTQELRKAQGALGYFAGQFEQIGKSLVKAQEAYDVARGHLNRYSSRVIGLTVEASPELNGDGGRAGK